MKKIREITIDKLEPGMVLARSVRGASGETLLYQNTELKSTYIKRLQEIEINKVYIFDDKYPEIEIAEPIKMQIRLETDRIITNVFQDNRVGRSIPGNDLKQQISKIIDELINQKSIVMNFKNIYLLSNYIYNHSVQTAIFSIALGIYLELTRAELEIIGIGAILHEIGIVDIDESIPVLENYNQFYPIIATRGYNKLITTEGINIESAKIVLEQFEYYNGKGQPNNLKAEKISYLARIFSIINYFDQEISDKPNIKGRPAYEVLEEVISLSGIRFDPKIVELFMRKAVVFAPGSTVKLNTGEIAAVIKSNENLPLRPIIMINFDKNKRPLEAPKEVDLLKALDLIITEVII